MGIIGEIAGLGQAIGLVLSKEGMSGDFSPFQANAIRMLAAAFFIWLWTFFEGKAGATVAAIREKPQVLRWLALGALVGPVLGVSASLLSAQRIEIGVASTFMAWTKSHTLFCRYYLSGNLAFAKLSQWNTVFGNCKASSAHM